MRCGLNVPVLRLQSQASASARSCLIGPSHDRLSWRNIHWEKTMKRELLETGPTGNWVYLFFDMYLFQGSVYIHLHLHDKQIWRLDELLHHLYPVNGQRQSFNTVVNTWYLKKGDKLKDDVKAKVLSTRTRVLSSGRHFDESSGCSEATRDTCGKRFTNKYTVWFHCEFTV